LNIIVHSKINLSSRLRYYFVKLKDISNIFIIILLFLLKTLLFYKNNLKNKKALQLNAKGLGIVRLPDRTIIELFA